MGFILYVIVKGIASQKNVSGETTGFDLINQ